MVERTRFVCQSGAGARRPTHPLVVCTVAIKGYDKLLSICKANLNVDDILDLFKDVECERVHSATDSFLEKKLEFNLLLDVEGS